MKNHSDTIMAGYGGQYDYCPKYDPKITRKRWKTDPEEERKISSIGSVHKGRGWREVRSKHYKLFEKILKKNIGRNWNTVYSELCELYTRPEERRLLDEYVQWEVNNVWYGWSGSAMYSDFFSDNSGILRFRGEKPNKYRSRKIPSPLFDGKYIKVKGVWYEYTFTRLKEHSVPSVHDMTFQYWRELENEYCFLKYDRELKGFDPHNSIKYSKVHPSLYTTLSRISRRTLNSKEIRNFRLNERHDAMMKANNQ